MNQTSAAQAVPKFGGYLFRQYASVLCKRYANHSQRKLPQK
jgi:hypothetical protein